MPAVKSSGNINITGTGNTLASITTDINDPSWIERTTDVDGSYIYTVKTVNANYMNILAGADLTIGNPNDFSFKEKLRLLYSSNNRGYIVIYPGTSVAENAILKVYGNSGIDFRYSLTATNQNLGTIQVQGNIIVEGNQTYKPEIKLSVGMLIYFAYQDVNTDIPKQQIIRFKYCNITHPLIELSCNSNRFVDEFTFEDVTIQFDALALSHHYVINVNNNIAYGIFANPSQLKFKNITLLNLPCKFSSESNIGYFENINIINTVQTNTPLFYNSARNVYNLFSVFGNNNSYNFLNQFNKTGQKIYSYFKNVFMKSVYIYIPVTADLVVYENVTHDSTANYVQTYIGRNLLLYNSDSIYNYPANRLNMAEKSSMKKVYKLDLTIKDEAGNIIEDAAMHISQKDYKEEYFCYSNSLGKIHSFYDLNCIFLANKVKNKPNKTASITEDVWSDTSNNTYHTVSVEKDGFKKYVFNIVMDQDREVEVILKPVGQIQKIRGVVRQFKLSGKVRQFKLKGVVKQNV